ncbi:MAG: cupin domain-containing protein [Deinococcales bacterium]
MTALEVIEILGLAPHPREGGFFVETYRSSRQLPPLETHPHPRLESTAIYYLLTPQTYSRLHRLRSDEIFHHYAGDTVEMLQLFPDGSSKVIPIGKDFMAGERPQVLAPAGVWQGSRLKAGGVWALLGCTVAPGFEYEDYEDAPRDYFLKRYSLNHELICALTPSP